MAKYDIDPVLQQLVRAINESGHAAAPITASVHGTVLTGALIAERAFFSELVAGHGPGRADRPGLEPDPGTRPNPWPMTGYPWPAPPRRPRAARASC